MATSRGKTFESGLLGSRRLSGTKSMVKSKIEGQIDASSNQLMQELFGSGNAPVDTTASTSEKPITLQCLPGRLEAELAALGENKHKPEQEDNEDYSSGRIGPDNVVFDISGNSGTLVIEADRLGVASHSNFSTIRANSCVYKGRWVFELMLGSKGVMQVGWCTFNCHFSQEEGVGDTLDSYAYDGNRLRKWNVKTVKYGESWLTGDVISCAIDCDEGTISFCRNGVDMGVAFSHIKLGPLKSYFPAVSLSMGENLRANFGATPLQYPLSGYRAMQDPPTLDLLQAQKLFSYLESLLPKIITQEQKLEQHPTPVVPVIPTLVECRSTSASLTLIAAHIFDPLAPLLRNSYIVEACLLRFLLKFSDASDMLGDQPYIQKTLDLIWAFLQEHEYKPCMDYLVISLLSSYRFSPVSNGFQYQTMYLTLLLSILRHEVTRKYLLKNVLFDKVRFPIFLHVKPPDDVELSQLIPTVWLGVAAQTSEEDDKECIPESDEERAQKEIYLSLCKNLRKQVAALETLQVEILKELLNNRDQNKGPSTRFVFLSKFRDFLKENSNVSTRCHFVNQCPLPVILCFFHRLIQAVRYYWDYHASHFPDKAVPSSEAFVPCRRFYDDSIDYFATQRLGGLLSHLKKTFKDELHAAQTSDSQEHRGPFDSLLQRLSMGSDSPKKNAALVEEQDSSSEVSAASLIEILDGIVFLYHIAAHKQLGKMCSLRDSVIEYVEALKDTEKKRSQCPPELVAVREELDRAHSVFSEKSQELARHMAWVIAVIYSPDKQSDVFWLLKTVLSTMENASKEDKLLAFVPDFYADVAINAYNALRGYFHPTTPYCNLQGFDETLVRYTQFLSDSVADSRIVHADVKDSLVQSLACCVCYKMSLKALERIPQSRKQVLIGHLLAPYEGRSWAQTNWILVRLWKGCGFGFRYKHLPHLLPSKNQQQEIGNASLQSPCPSLVFQHLVGEQLKSDVAQATKLIDSILNQLNWAFSEFIGMVQELQQLRLRPIMGIVDMRQLKVCATCFDISVGLLRVLEMIVSLAPELLMDWQQPSAELLLCRLFQLITQVLNRVTSRSNLFDLVTSINVSCLETVDHFPILTAITGILLRLIKEGLPVSRERATAALLAEPGFQLGTLEFLLGEISEAASPVVEEKKVFSLRKYTEISSSEVEQVEWLITFLREEEVKSKQTTPEIDDDALCSICFAWPNSVLFKPCGHESCKACISRHLMSKKDCFFCKAHIKTVMDMTTGKPITINSKETTV